MQPRDPKKAPRALGEVIEGALAAQRAAMLKPGYAERLAAYEDAIARRRSAEQRELMDRRGLPEHARTREVAVTHVPRLTTAMVWCKRAVQMREQSRSTPLTLVLSGVPGCGKTCGVAWALVNHPGGGLFVAAQSIAACPDTGWSENANRWDAWRSAKMLVVDEMGDERGTDASNAAIAALFAERHNRGLATLATTNLTGDVFAARYVGGGRLYSRLQHEQAMSQDEPEDSLAMGGFPWWVNAPEGDLRSGEATRLRLVREAE